MNRRYAEKFGDAWVILSAKYGLIVPTFLIPEPYEVTFKKRSTGPVSFGTLHEQVREQQLARFDQVIGLGGLKYRAALTEAFRGQPVTLAFPFAGLSLGYTMQAIKRAL